MQELEEGERKQMAEEEDYMRSYSSLGWLFASKPLRFGKSNPSRVP